MLRQACVVLIWLLLPGLARADEPEAPASHPQATDRRIAVTFDDLPWASLTPATPKSADGSVPAPITEHAARLLAAITAARTPAIGFVNESRLLADGTLQPDRVAMLQAWLEAGLELGNHTASHLDLHQVGLPAYEQDILDGERQLRPLLAARGTTLRWFRHPYLRTGRGAEEKAALAAFLAAHGYRIAPVTVTTSDWAWAAAYRKALDAGDTAMRDRIHAAYVPYLLRMVRYFEIRSDDLLGRALPQVLLLHANELNADTYDAFVAGLRARGYRFITLDEALQDPAYLRPDAYDGALGTSWLHRWAIAAGRSWTFYGGMPTSPRWLIDYAGVGDNQE